MSEPKVDSPYALHRRLYDWVLSFAHHPHSTAALFLISFAESSFFPIAPDILQIALTLEKQKLAWFYAAINTLGSVLGGVFGYLIGALVWQFIANFFFTYVFSEQSFQRVQALYQQHDFLAVFTAAFTPIPYKVFTIAAGVFQISFPMFLLASILGRAGRFFAVATLLWFFGKSIKTFIEKYFNVLTCILLLLLIGGFLLLT